MIYSMTGYGRVVKDIPGKKITIEIKTLNSKQFDLSVRVPSYYREKELEIRNKLAKELLRGKIDFSMYVELIDEQTNTSINEAIYKGYYNQLESIYKGLGKELPPEATVDILRLPDVLTAEHATLDEEEWSLINDIIEEAIVSCNSYRLQEGQAMYADLQERVKNIGLLLKEIEPIEKERIEKIRERIRTKLEDFIDPEKVDENRFEQELIHFLDKLDVNEEMVRLSNHCEYFLQTIEEEGANGKKLGFISQEIGREINTLGSKANEASMQKLVVRMKDQLEKIKEQSLNIL
ncbi:MAG: YicC family protein [Salinivirgaceae bacterium]|nr:MAG: YicC family protein [Salinivirgaceae bacterium]